jgi:hypothetical protein
LAEPTRNERDIENKIRLVDTIASLGSMKDMMHEVLPITSEFSRSAIVQAFKESDFFEVFSGTILVHLRTTVPKPNRTKT